MSRTHYLTQIMFSSGLCVELTCTAMILEGFFFFLEGGG